jgi:hypothetical protein
MRATSSAVLITLGTLLSCSLGCGGVGNKSASADKVVNMKASPAEGAPAKATAYGAAAAPPAGAVAQKGPVQAERLARKIIYNGEIQVIVEDFAAAYKDLLGLVKAHQGMFFAQSDVSTSTGAPRQGRWRVRLPVDDFETFRDSVAALGEVQKNTSDATDVTDEFYDLQKRLDNKRAEEKRLLEHLQKSTGNLADILTVEKELSRVREEAERLQGQAERLNNLSSLATLDVTLHERKSYVPPATPAFGTTLGRTFDSSVDLLVSVGKALVLAAVALGPWLAVLAVLAVPVWLVQRRRRGIVAPRAVPVAERPPAPA